MTAAIFLPPGGVAGLAVRADMVVVRSCRGLESCDGLSDRSGEANPWAYQGRNRPVVFVFGGAGVVELATV